MYEGAPSPAPPAPAADRDTRWNCSEWSGTVEVSGEHVDEPEPPHRIRRIEHIERRDDYAVLVRQRATIGERPRDHIPQRVRSPGHDNEGHPNHQRAAQTP